MSNIKKKKGICGICPYSCEVCIELEEAMIKSVSADTDAPNGSLCPRGRHAPDIIYNDNRILYPMIRNGPKGTKCFRRASWEEALSIAADRFKKCKEAYGPQSLISYSGASSLEDSLIDYGDNFFSYYGSPNDMNSGSICFMPSKVIGPQLSLGLYGYQISADIKRSKVIYLWGRNPETDSGKSSFHELLNLQKKGAVIVAIDPRSNHTTKIADYWLRIKPGTDGALIMALTKRIIENSEYDTEFTQKFALGMSSFKKLLKKTAIEDLLIECGINRNDFEKICALFSTTTAQSFLSYTGLEYQPSSVDTIRMMYILWAVTGKLDVPGGMLISEGRKAVYHPNFPTKILPIGADKYPVFYYYSERGQFGEFPKAALEGIPYPAKGLLIYAASPLLSYPNRKLMEEAYKNQEIMVVIERSWSDECLWADIVLPATTYYENLSYCYYENRTRLRKRIIDPLGESKNDLYILHALAKNLGFGDKFPSSDKDLLSKTFSEEEIRELYRNEYGIFRKISAHTYKKYEKGLLREDGKPGFPTPSGMVEIESSVLSKYGYNGVPQYQTPYDNKAFPYALVTGARSKHRYNANGLNCSSLVTISEPPCAEMDASLADTLHLKDGDVVEVSTENGSLKLPVKIHPMAHNTVHIPVGGGGCFQFDNWKYTPANELCDFYKRDSISGFITCKSVGCNINKLKGLRKDEKKNCNFNFGCGYDT